TEAMAANRPVLCWKVPERPRMLEVFRDGEEILYYSNPEQLQECTERLRTEPQLSKRLAERAQQALWQRHTTEIRVKQLLNFVATGEEPDYSA
ncbi:MAG: glycosyltransferase family 1 protein, partial [Candidatus Eremiobacteraeota bacterium]|nr:glycosyltransferase family 1 protein [Candidatus Eremiobacteraeota bacterium]